MAIDTTTHSGFDYRNLFRFDSITYTLQNDEFETIDECLENLKNKRK